MHQQMMMQHQAHYGGAPAYYDQPPHPMYGHNPHAGYAPPPAMYAASAAAAAASRPDGLGEVPADEMDVQEEDVEGLLDEPVRSLIVPRELLPRARRWRGADASAAQGRGA